MLGSDIAM